MSDVSHRDVTMTDIADTLRAVEDAPETVAAFVGRTLRGPLNMPVLLSSARDFRRRFGGPGVESAMWPAVRAFFRHGGRSLFVVRVANAARGPMLCLPASGGALILRGVEPGYTETIRAAVDYDRVDVSDKELFNLTLQRIDPDSRLVIDQEYFPASSCREDHRRFIGDLLTGSSLARLGKPYPLHSPEPTSLSATGDSAGYAGVAQRGCDGEPLSDYDLVGSREKSTGLFALDKCPHFDLLYLPTAGDRDIGPAAAVAAEMYCRQRGAMLILDPDKDCEDGISMLRRLRARDQRSPDALTYFPRIRSQEAADRAAHCGGAALAGLLCRHDRQRGPWSDLALPESRLDRTWRPAFDLEDDLADALERSGVNAIVGCSAGRAYVRGSVTMSCGGGAERCFASLGVRRGCLRILNTVKQATRYVAFQTGSDALERRIEQELGRYLRRLADAGALASDRFVIMCHRCDAPGALLPQRRVTILLVFQPAGSPGPLSFTLQQTQAGCRITSAAFAPAIRHCA